MSDFKTLSDSFMAAVGIAATKPHTALAMAVRIQAKLITEGPRLRPEKRADMERVVSWLYRAAGTR